MADGKNPPNLENFQVWTIRHSMRRVAPAACCAAPATSRHPSAVRRASRCRSPEGGPAADLQTRSDLQLPQRPCSAHFLPDMRCGFSAMRLARRLHNVFFDPRSFMEMNWRRLPAPSPGWNSVLKSTRRPSRGRERWWRKKAAQGFPAGAVRTESAAGSRLMGFAFCALQKSRAMRESQARSRGSSGKTWPRPTWFARAVAAVESAGRWSIRMTDQSDRGRDRAINELDACTRRHPSTRGRITSIELAESYPILRFSSTAVADQNRDRAYSSTGRENLALLGSGENRAGAGPRHRSANPRATPPAIVYDICPLTLKAIKDCDRTRARRYAFVFRPRKVRSSGKSANKRVFGRSS